MKCAALTLAITRVSAALGADNVSWGVVIGPFPYRSFQAKCNVSSSVNATT
jgi:hypothetical protein